MWNSIDVFSSILDCPRIYLKTHQNLIMLQLYGPTNFDLIRYSCEEFNEDPQ